MRFKRSAEAFDYSQSGLTMSSKLKYDIEEFINELEVIKHAYDHISPEDIEVLQQAIEVLDEFYLSYKLMADRKVRQLYIKED